MSKRRKDGKAVQRKVIKDMIKIKIPQSNPLIVFNQRFDSQTEIPLHQLTHLLVTGVSGAGKTHLLENIIYQTIEKSSPNLNQFFVISSLNYYELDKSKFLPLGISLPEEAFGIIKMLSLITKNRIAKLQESKKRTLDEYNESSPNKLPHLFLIIDSYPDLLTYSHALEPLLALISQIGRAVGVHLFIANQGTEHSLLSALPCRMQGYTPNKRLFASSLNLPENDSLISDFKKYEFIYRDSLETITKFSSLHYSQDEIKNILVESSKSKTKTIVEIDGFSVEGYKEQLVKSNQAFWTQDHKYLKPANRKSIFS